MYNLHHLKKIAFNELITFHGGNKKNIDRVYKPLKIVAFNTIFKVAVLGSLYCISVSFIAIMKNNESIKSHDYYFNMQ